MIVCDIYARHSPIFHFQQKSEGRMSTKRILQCIIRLVGLFVEGNQNLKREKYINNPAHE